MNRSGAIAAFLLERVSRATGLRPADIDATASFFSLGLTSLDAVELARALAEFTALDLPSTVAWDYPTIERLAGHCVASRADRTQTVAPEETAAEPLAIVGMGCRFPGAAGAAAFFEMLCRGDDPISEVPPERWPVDEYFSSDLSAPAKMVSRWGGFIPRLDTFDAAFFRMSPREAAHLDPRQRLMLEAAWEAFEDAGIPALQLAGSDTGVFVATLASNYGSLLFDQHLPLVDAYSGTGNGNSVTANRLSYFFDLHGPSLALDTACSGSLVALHLACRSLRSGETTLALVGGVNVILKPDDSVFFSKTGALSPDGMCRVFDRRANGIVRSEGAGCLVVRRLSDAVSAGDRIYAVIHGTAVNQDGATNGLMAPNGQAQQQLLTQAYRAAGIDPAAVQYVEAHGTGTVLGDPIEVGALSAVLGAGRPAGRRCALGSVKSNIGHTEAAAGMAGVIKAALSIHHGIIPGNLHYDEPNPLVPFDRIPLFVQQHTAAWPQPEEPRVAGVSAFGFAGTNAHVVLGPPPPSVDAPAVDTDLPRVLAISARSDASLRSLAATYAGAWTSAVDYAAMCHASTTQRSYLEHRLAMVEPDPARAAAQLRAFASGETDPGLHHGVTRLDRTPPVGFLFSGQGSHWAGMGRRLFARERVFRAVIEECDELYRRATGRSLIAELATDAGDSRLNDTAVGQPAIFAVQAGLSVLLRAWGIVPAFALGQSLGEAAAAFASGALSLADAFHVVRLRSHLMSRVAGLGRTAAVGLPADEVRTSRAVAAGGVTIAGTLSPALTLVSGATAPIDAWVEALASTGVFARLLPVDVALHGPQMDALRDELVAGLDNLRPQPATVPFISSVTGSEVPGEELGPAYWYRNMREPYQFDAAFAHARATGCSHFVELSPHPLLVATATTLMGGHAGGRCVGSLRRGVDESRAVLDAVAALYAAGVPVAWPSVCGSRGRIVPLPHYAWNRERYWFDQLESVGAARPGKPVDAPRHPLLGVPVHVSVGAGAHIWESRLGPDRPGLLAHHTVQGAVVLPASAFVELALAAARALAPSGPAPRVESLTLVSGLALPDARLLQTVAERDGAHLRMRFLSAEPDSFEWTVHATADCVAATSALDHVQAPAARIAGMVAWPVEEHYAAMAARGLRYSGPFRALTGIWRAEGTAVGRIERGDASTGARAAAWHCDPSLLDACLQLVAAASSDDDTDLRLPTGLAGIDCPAALPDRFWCYADARPLDPGKPGRFVAELTLVDDGGAVLARVDRAAFDRVGAGATAVGANLRRWMYEVEWRPAAALSAARLPDVGPVVDAFAADAAPLADSLALDHYGSQWPAFDRLVVASILNAMRTLGVAFEPGVTWSPDVVAAAAGVVPRHHRLLRRLLGILKEDRVLADDWTLPHVPVWDTPDAIADDIRQRFPAAVAELGLVQRGASRLAALLTGQADPLEVLFAHDSDDLLERLYRDSVFMRYYNRAVRDAVVAAAQSVGSGRPLRVLEVGGGTGATTQHVLPALEGHRYEYVFTDVSPRLVDLAREKFSVHDGVTCRVLDIETPVTADASLFDIVIAANVLHATADLRETVRHVRQLLAPGGWLLLLEGPGPQRWLDLVVGATDGWWRFQDDVRADYPLIAPAAWARLLAESGFDETRTVVDPTPAPPQFVMIARAASLTSLVARVRWLIVSSTPHRDAGTIAYLTECGAECQVVAPDELDGQRLHDLVTAPGPAWRVLHMAALDAPREAQLSLDAIDRLEQGILFSAIRLVQLFIRQGPSARLWFVTQGAVPAAPVEALGPIAIAQAPLWGIGRVVASEHPELFGGLVDLGGEAGPDTAERLVLEVLCGSDDNQVVLRDDGRATARLVPLRASATPQPWRLHRDGAYLVTGGVRGIGLAVAERMLERGARHLVLLSRTVLPPRAMWRALDSGEAGYDVVQAVLRLESLGADVLVLTADIGAGGLRELLARYDAEARPPIRGVVHSAGLIEDHLIARMDAEAFARATRPKIRGAWLLHDAFSDRALDFFVLFSSGTSLLGTFGQANYAAGNAFLDALAHVRRQRGLPATVINWGVWGSVGIVARRGHEALLAQNGLIEIEPSAGLDALEYVIGLGATQVAVMPTDWAMWRQAHPGFDRLRFFADVHSQEQTSPSRPATAADAAMQDRVRALRQAQGAARPAAAVAYTSVVVASALRIDPARLDVDAPLPTLGLDSIMAVEMRNRIDSDIGVGISIVELLNGLSASQIADRLAAAMPSPAGSPALEATRAATLVAGPLLEPCTPGQRSLWHTEQLNEQRAPVYNVAVEVELDRPVDPAALRTALAQIVQRHEPLRTGFVERDGVPLQRITPDVTVDLRVGSLPEADEWERMAAEAVNDLAREPFTLDAPSLARFLLLNGRDRARFALSVHHLVFDGWSAGVLVRELAECYSAIVGGRAPQLPPLSIAYRDYARQSQRDDHAQAVARDLEYWARTLAGRWTMLELPLDAPRPVHPSFSGSKMPIVVDRTQAERIRHVGRREGVTPFVVLAHALGLTLHLESGQTELVLGVTPSQRERQELAALIGYFVTMLPLALSFGDAEPFVDGMRRLRQAALEAFDHQSAVLGDIQRAVRDASGERMPGIQAVFTLQNSPMALPPIVRDYRTVDNGTAKFDLVLNLVERADGLDGWWEYRSDLFQAATIARLSERFLSVLQAVVDDPHCTTAELRSRTGVPFQATAPAVEEFAFPRVSGHPRS